VIGGGIAIPAPIVTQIEGVLHTAGIERAPWHYFSAADASYMDLPCGVRVRILWARFKGQVDKVDVSLMSAIGNQVHDIEQLPDMIRALTGER
jgi:hypothetical protein